MGGSEDDPVARVVGSLGGLDERLDSIRDALLNAADQSGTNSDVIDSIRPQLHRLEQALNAVAQPKLEVSVRTEASKELDTLLKRQAQAIEQTLIPMVVNSTKNMETTRNIGQPLAELLELLKLKLMAGNNPITSD